MTNADGNAGETSPSDPGPQPSYEFGPSGYGADATYPPAVDYPSNIPPDYPPPAAFGPSFPVGPGYPPPLPGYPPPPPPYGMPGGYPPGYPAPGFPVGYGMTPANTTNNLAIGSLVASIVSVPLLAMCAIGLIVAFVGIGLGATALNQIKQSGEAGRGLAIAGIVVGIIGALLNGGWILFFIIGLASAA
ncbi:hypothetical protein A5740_22010 [Mycobacterium sp. GA-1841]|uniref:DUF4190 domain-containing protein n=1 Tax=Mycobacterium sp. GA-1841 TaxID=1834154 RepID=UPI00096CEFA2|nr:DUF4190 domain-containing protein [Mycobacterium sp. GA-1841]OMC41627.1 hypothetical protein A5740_22010 [Mycobacterium sp. GA-1841]